jgi:hypothetical protein
MSAMTTFAVVFAVGAALAFDREVSVLLGVAFALPMSAFVLAIKTLFPREIGHRAPGLATYVVIGQIISAVIAATFMELLGECFDCGGNIHDTALYGLTIGTASGIIYASFSKIFSLDVDTPALNV